MRSYIAVLFLVLAGCRENGLVPVTKCGQECYTLGAKAGVGQCRSGSWLCEGEDESTAVCQGQVGPATEVCDGIDNDCNGTVDRFWADCTNTCGSGRRGCDMGAWTECMKMDGGRIIEPLVPKPETCNSLDDDCDGFVDELEDLPIVTCYDAGAPETLRYGACRPGVERCRFGKVACDGQVGPKPETCDSEDNDCDGQVDEGTSSGRPVDFAFIVDCSGSMWGTISAVQQAVASFSFTYSGRTDIKWALVGATDPNPVNDTKVVLMAPLGGAAAFSQAVQTLAATGGGGEPTMDAIYDLTGPQNPLGIVWTPGSKHVLVLFTDEMQQSYRTPLITNIETNASLISSGAELYIFTVSYEAANWQACGPPAQVSMQTLTSLPAVMEMALIQIIMETTCH